LHELCGRGKIWGKGLVRRGGGPSTVTKKISKGGWGKDPKTDPSNLTRKKRAGSVQKEEPYCRNALQLLLIKTVRHREEGQRLGRTVRKSETREGALKVAPQGLTARPPSHLAKEQGLLSCRRGLGAGYCVLWGQRTSSEKQPVEEKRNWAGKI